MNRIETDMGPLDIPEGDHSTICYLEDGRYNEYLLTERLRSVMTDNREGNKAPLFIDIGANMGYYTRMASPLVQRVISVEASLRNFFYLTHNTRDLDNVSPFRAMAWNLDVEGDLFLDANNCADNRPFSGNGTPEKSLKMRLETIIRSFECVHGPLSTTEIIVKIDTQGSDHIVLDGFGEYRDRISHCFVECWPFGMNELDGSSLASTCRMYEQWGFEVLPIEMPLEDIKGDSYVNLHLRNNG